MAHTSSIAKQPEDGRPLAFSGELSDKLDEGLTDELIDIKLARVSYIQCMIVLACALLLSIVVFSSALVLLFKIAVLGTTLPFCVFMLRPLTLYRLRFYESYWLVEVGVAREQIRAYQMQLESMQNFVFCKHLYFAGESLNPIQIGVYKDQVSSDDWRKLCVLGNFKQLSNKFY